MTKLFKREYLEEGLDLPYAAIERKIIDYYRWCYFEEIIFQDKDGTYWKTERLNNIGESSFMDQ